MSFSVDLPRKTRAGTTISLVVTGPMITFHFANTSNPAMEARDKEAFLRGFDVAQFSEQTCALPSVGGDSRFWLLNEDGDSYLELSRAIDGELFNSILKFIPPAYFYPGAQDTMRHQFNVYFERYQRALKSEARAELLNVLVDCVNEKRHLTPSEYKAFREQTKKDLSVGRWRFTVSKVIAEAIATLGIGVKQLDAERWEVRYNMRELADALKAYVDGCFTDRESESVDAFCQERRAWSDFFAGRGARNEFDCMTALEKACDSCSESDSSFGVRRR